MSWLASLVAAILKVLLDQFRLASEAAKNAQKREELGAERQKNADIEASNKAENEASDAALAPPDREKTLKNLDNGTF